MLGIRPEHLTLEPSPGLLTLDLQVGVLESMGADTVIWGTVAGEKASVRVSSELNLNPPRGSNLAASFALSSASLFDAESGVRL